MIPLVSSQQFRQIDEETIQKQKIRSTELMELAGTRCADKIMMHVSIEKLIYIFCGTGNNGGDGLVIARIMQMKGYNVQVFILKTGTKPTPDFQVNLSVFKKLSKHICIDVDSINQVPEISNACVVVDAIFGTGLSRKSDGLIRDVIKYINKKRCTVYSVDVPSGLLVDSSSKEFADEIIQATVTLSIGLPKICFLFPENDMCTGEVITIDIGLDQEAIAKAKTTNFLIDFDHIRTSLLPRKKYAHKGNFGHAYIISGSKGKMGAAVLSAKACLRSGAGLVSIQVPSIGYSIIQTALPEAMVVVDEGENCLETLVKFDNYTCLGIGPGIGVNDSTAQLLKGIIQSANRPIVFDADALNILSENKTWLSFLPANSVLTPHPKEFERLFGKTNNDYERLELLRFSAVKFNVTIVLKGHHTIIASPTGNCFFNTTGNAGMATGGSGDVLTGIITGFIAQGIGTLDACIEGVFIHGLAADIALDEESEESLIASDIAAYLGRAFNLLHA